MTLKLTTALALGLIVAGCSNEPASGPEAQTEAAAGGARANAPADADDDTLEPEAPKVEEGQEHNEDAPHTH